MNGLPNSLVMLLGNILTKERYSEHNQIHERDLPESVTFEFKVGGYVDPNCAISRFMQGPKNMEIKCNVIHADPVTGRRRYSQYDMTESGDWKKKQY